MVNHDGVDDIRAWNPQDLVGVLRQEVVGRVLERPRYHRRTCPSMRRASPMSSPAPCGTGRGRRMYGGTRVPGLRRASR